jgi:hypothetical protein
MGVHTPADLSLPEQSHRQFSNEIRGWLPYERLPGSWIRGDDDAEDISEADYGPRVRFSSPGDASIFVRNSTCAGEGAQDEAVRVGCQIELSIHVSGE